MKATLTFDLTDPKQYRAHQAALDILFPKTPMQPASPPQPTMPHPGVVPQPQSMSSAPASQPQPVTASFGPAMPAVPAPQPAPAAQPPAQPVTTPVPAPEITIPEDDVRAKVHADMQRTFAAAAAKDIEAASAILKEVAKAEKTEDTSQWAIETIRDAETKLGAIAQF